MRYVEKVTKNKTGLQNITYAVKVYDTVEEAIKDMGTINCLAAINYSVGVKASKEATKEPKLPKEVRSLLLKDPELRALALRKLQK